MLRRELLKAWVGAAVGVMVPWNLPAQSAAHRGIPAYTGYSVGIDFSGGVETAVTLMYRSDKLVEVVGVRERRYGKLSHTRLFYGPREDEQPMDEHEAARRYADWIGVDISRLENPVVSKYPTPDDPSVAFDGTVKMVCDKPFRSGVIRLGGEQKS